MAKRIYHRKFYAKNKEKKLIFSLLKSSALAASFILIGSVFVFLYFAKDLPRPEKFTESHFILPTKIYDRTGEILLYEIYGEEKRTMVSLEKTPLHLKQAVIAAEDASFYRHFGLDIRGITRAVLNNLKLGRPVQGGSTITQQLIRSTFLTLEKTLKRKVREVILTLELERRYSKDQILEWYLNQVPFGANAYGVEAASQTFFNKSVKDISLEESAILASLIQAPSYLSPYGSHKNDLLIRKDYILNQMAKAGYITKKEAEEAQVRELSFSEIRQSIKSPHFVLYVKKYLEDKYGQQFLREKGLKVYTTLDWELQEFAERAVQEGTAINNAYDAHNAALLAMNPKNGEIIAMVGSVDWNATSSYPQGCEGSEEGCLFDPKFNITTLGERQPGSAFKPFAYATAFQKGYTRETVVWDVETEFNPDCDLFSDEEKDPYDQDCYRPQNYDENFRGPISLREALSQSINIASVKVLYLAGLQETIDLAKNIGITTLNKTLSWYGLSLVLGGGEVKLLDLVSAYSVFANDGLQTLPSFILKIEDINGSIIEENKKTPRRVLEAQTTRLLNSVLSDNEARSPMFGSRSMLFFPGYDVAAKTGTTQDFRDAWTIGYNPLVVVGVWVGNNNNSSMAEKPGVVLAGPIFHRVMEKFLIKHPKESFKEPEVIETQKPVLNNEIDWENPHSILHYLDKDNPQKEMVKDPLLNPQYLGWEAGIENWLSKNQP